MAALQTGGACTIWLGLIRYMIFHLAPEVLTEQSISLFIFAFILLTLHRAVSSLFPLHLRRFLSKSVNEING
jgi:hypothetical protein